MFEPFEGRLRRMFRRRHDHKYRLGIGVAPAAVKYKVTVRPQRLQRVCGEFHKHGFMNTTVSQRSRSGASVVSRPSYRLG